MGDMIRFYYNKLAASRRKYAGRIAAFLCLMTAIILGTFTILTAPDKTRSVDRDNTNGRAAGRTESSPLLGIGGLSFIADHFSVYALVGTLEKTLQATDGLTYRVTVSYSEEAQIPEGSYLSVDEISTEAYDEYLAKSAEAIGSQAGFISYAKFFDITIWKDGQAVQPASPVDVKISLLTEEAVENENNAETTAQVVHFGEEVQVVEPATRAVTDAAGISAFASGENAARERVEVEFEADGFSVYGVVYTVECRLKVDGRTYKITLTYDEKAEIPAGTKLVAEEIQQGTEEYLQYLGEAWAEVNKEYLEQEEYKNRNQGGLDDYEDIRPVNLDDARFFDISLLFKGKEIEPKAPVHVEIEYVDGLETEVEEEEQVIGVAHYKKNEVELITEIETERDEEGKIIELAYDQDSFSAIGTYVGQKTYDNVPYEIDSALAMPLLRALSRSGGDERQLKDIEAHKRLSDNHDGTYTMSLTVKGDTIAYEEYNKANVLFVMDRSSSMTSNKVYQVYKGSTYPEGTKYYGKNGNNYEQLYRYNGQFYTNSLPGGYTPYNGTVYTSVTRLEAEQATMDVLIQNLLGKNDADTPGKEDLIEISVISFADDRQSGNTEYTNWTSYDYTGLMAAVNQTDTPSGTNWEDALMYAKEQADAKKRVQPEEDVYVIFLTDGEPTAVFGEHGGAQHYISNGYVTREGFEYALTEDPRNTSWGENDGKNSLDRAKEIVGAGYKFYGIFTFNPGEAQTKYLRRLMNFAYTGVDKAYENDSTKEDTDIVKKYFTNADTPETLTAAFEKIFADISNTLGHGNVVITDGLQSADAMTTTIHADKADGFRYSVTNDTTGEELYYVTATGNDSSPTVTFHIGGQEYPAGAAKTGVDGKPYYSVLANGTEYKMALADLTGRELKWDLSAIGTLLPDCTYKMDIIVWPNQAAYDYVAGLNNHLPGYTWDSNVETDPTNYHEVTVDGVTYGYYTGGVAGHSSIVKYKDRDVYSVLTNTHQELNYSIVNTKTNEVTGETTSTSTPQRPISLEPQKPMDLVDTNSNIEKQWNVDLDPSIFAQLLYPADGSHYTLTFAVYQDTGKTPYKTITLGWDADLKKYVWEEGSEKEIPYNNTTYSIGTTWKKAFAVPTGLMLSEERMDALGMDKSAYPSGTYPVDPEDPESEKKTYYLLEDGHDYTIKEQNLSYEFDFNADVFHPMLVDGKMQNVRFTKSGKTVSISEMTNTAGGLSSLKVENTLRGYIHLEKQVVDKDDKLISDDKTKFEYTLVLTNEAAPFKGTHIPWYGINGLYYHDKNFNYYQVYYENNLLKIKDESGNVYQVKGSFDVNEAEEQDITYIDGEDEISLKLMGNQTTPSNENKTATTTLQISQGELLSIANIPAGTGYSIVESKEAGYTLVSIEKRIDPDDVQEEAGATSIDINSRLVSGTIVPNHHNYITYKNRSLVATIYIQKVDAEGEGLEGAVFQLKKVLGDGREEELATAIETISGIGDVNKTIDGRTATFNSSFETTGEIQSIKGLPDGTYRLYEVYVPAGYVSTFRYIQFKIEDRVMKDVTVEDGDTGVVDTTANNINLKITNEAGAALPNAGGPGTMSIYVFGLILAGIAGAGLMRTQRRKKAA